MSLSSKLIASSAFLLFTKIIYRGFGLISTLILARILTPDDFGLVAIIALTAQFFEIIGETGSETYLLQKKNVDSSDINSAWTLNLFIKSILWFIFVLLVPFIVNFYDNPKLELPLYAISITILIKALSNPCIILLKKNLDYRPLFNLAVAQKVISFSAVIGIAYFYRSFWAMIIGDIVTVVVFLIGTYIIKPFKPKFMTQRIREQWLFSQWILLKSILGFTRSRLDIIMVTKLFDTAILGQFYVIKNIAVTLGMDLLSSLLEPLLTTFAQAKDDMTDLSNKVFISFIVLLSIVCPIFSFLFFYPNLIVNFFLGAKWHDTYDLMSALSIMLFTASIGWFFHHCCVALGKVKVLFYFDLFSVIFIFSILYVYRQVDIVGFSYIRSFLALFVTFIFFILTRHIINISTKKILLFITPIVLSITFAVFWVNQITIRFGWPIFDLAVKGAFFTIIYVISLITCSFLFLHKTAEYKQIRLIISTLLNK